MTGNALPEAMGMACLVRILYRTAVRTRRRRFHLPEGVLSVIEIFRQPSHCLARCMLPSMTRARGIGVFLLGVALALPQSVLPSAQASVPCGEIANGLRLSLDVDYNAHELLFYIQNVSDRTQVVDLGHNSIPVQLTVTLTTKDGKVRDSELGMSSAMHAMGAGIHEDFVEILPKGMYRIRRAMDDFTPLPAAMEQVRVFPLTALKSGDLMTGNLRGKGPKCWTGDSRQHQICWEGQLVSNTVQVN